MTDQTNVKLRLNNSELWGGLIGLALGGFVIWSGLSSSSAPSTIPAPAMCCSTPAS